MRSGRNRNLLMLAAGLALLALLVTGAYALQAAPPLSTPTAPPTTASGDAFDIPPEVAGHEHEWPLANHDYANTRAAVSATINAGNVADLKVAWTVKLTGSSEWGAASGAPVISDGIVYFQDLGANTYAVDLLTGREIWKTKYENGIFGPVGPGLGYGRVYISSRIDRYSALDIRTGEELWQFNTGLLQRTGAFQPSVFDHKVYASLQAANSGRGRTTFDSYAGGTTGVALLLDPTNGAVIWRWQAVEEGFWGRPDLNSGGGLWFPPAIDTVQGVSYWATGNPSPVPGLKGYPNGASRPGPTCTPTPWWRSTTARARCSGTTRSSPTTCSTSTSRCRPCWPPSRAQAASGPL